MAGSTASPPLQLPLRASLLLLLLPMGTVAATATALKSTTPASDAWNTARGLRTDRGLLSALPDVPSEAVRCTSLLSLSCGSPPCGVLGTDTGTAAASNTVAVLFEGVLLLLLLLPLLFCWRV